MGSRDTAPRRQGPFAVVYAGPREKVAPMENGAVTVLFNRSMRTFDAADDAGLPPLALQTEAGTAIAGTWRFVGTHGLLFTPQASFPGATRFNVTVGAGARSLDGDSLPNDYKFSFFTALPEVVGATPSEGARDLRADSVLRLDFNQRMEPDAVAQKARVWVRAKPGDAAKSIALRGAHPPKREGAIEAMIARAVVLTPVEPLPLDSEVRLVVEAGLTGEGPLGSKAPFVREARTYGPLRLADVVCPKVAPGRCQAHRDVTVMLNNDVAPAEFKAHLKTALPAQKPGSAKVDKSAEAVAARAKAREPRRDHLLGADPEPGQRYRITLQKGMRDVFGQTLPEDVRFEVEIEAPFVTADGKQRIDPKLASGANPGYASTSVSQQGEGDVTEPNDPRPRRAQLAYDLTLGIRGHVVEAVGKGGSRPHLVPVGALNVPTYGLFAAKMRPADAIVWLGNKPRASAAPLSWNWVSPGVPENTRAVKNIDLDALLGGADARGVALLAVGWPGSSAFAHQSELVTVTDLGISGALSSYGSMVWVTRLSTGQPVPGATVSVQRAGEQREAFRGVTDAQGLIAIEKRQFDPVKNGGVDSEAFLFVSADDDWTYQRVERAMASSRSNVSVDLQQRGSWAGMLYTDRGVYRPGETLKLAGMFRKVDAAGMKTVPGAEARIQVTDSQSERVFEGRAKLDSFGGIALDVPLPKTSHLGDAYINASIAAAGGTEFSAQVLLASYKASEFKVALESSKSEYVRGDEAVFDVHAEYLFGAAMGNVALRTTAARSRTSFVPPGASAFAVSDEASVLGTMAAVNPRAEELSDADDMLDDRGAAKRTLKLDLPRMNGPEQVTLEAEVKDLTNQTVARRATVLVHPAAFYLGLKRPQRRFLAVGAELPATLVAFDPAGKHVAGIAAKVELVRRTWVGVVEDVPAETATTRSQIKDEVVDNCLVTTTAAEATCKLRVDQPGFYLVRATSSDARRNAVGASTSFYAVDDRADEATAKVSFPRPDARGVELEADKPVYSPGENARILVRSPFRDAEALVTVQRGGVLWHRIVALKGPMPTVEVPMRTEYFPNVFVSVHLVRGRIQAAPTTGADLGAPEFRVGMTELKVDPNSHRLDVRLVTPRSEYHPGENVDVDLTVAGTDGRRARTSVTLYAVDEGVLMLTGYKTPDPLPAFTTERGLAVFGLDSRESLARILSLKNGEKIRPLGYDFLGPASGDKGEDGGDGGGGENAVRADFKTTAFFEAGRVTSNEGTARFQFKLPDNLTTFRLMAIASAEDDRFGFGESRITTSRKLMARPALPRIVRVGDQFDAGVVVSSKDLPSTNVNVELRATGLEASGPATSQVTLSRGRSVEVRFPVKATASGPASLEFVVTGAGQQDKVLAKRNVELPVSRETVAVYGETNAAAAVALGDLRNARPDSGGLEVHVSSTALAGIGTAFEQNLDYPYGCTEQLVSRTLPLLLLSDLARAFHVRLPAKLDDVIDGAIGEILSHQDGSGGFGYWEGDSPQVPWLSAYAVLALETAAEKRFYVPKGARDQAIAYLSGVVARTSFAPKSSDDEGSEEEPRADVVATEEALHGSYADVAFVVGTLATVGQAQPGTLNLLFDARRDKPLFAQALLLHAMAKAKMPRATLDILASELVSQTRVGADEASVDQESDQYAPWLDSAGRTTALVLRALLAVDPQHPLAPRLARGLLARREHGAFRSTQENTWALLALDEYRKNQESREPNFDAQVFLGSDLIGNANFHGSSVVEVPFSVPAARLLKNQGPLTFSLTGSGKLFYSAELRYASASLPARPADSGFSVQRIVRALKPSELVQAQATVPLRGDSKANVNDLVMMDVLFETAEPREQVVLDDPLPAGLEPIDFGLQTSSMHAQVSESPALANQPRALGTLGYGAFRSPSGLHRELHDDRVLTFLSHVEPGIYHFRYLARATTPGRFVVPPLRADCMYSPEISGRSAATTFEVVSASRGAVASAR
ncbi:MAG: MG2 domain-containing protein [Polyangiaceae bacterium]